MDLVRELAKFFVFVRLASTVNQVMKDGAKMAVRKGHVREVGGRIIISSVA